MHIDAPATRGPHGAQHSGRSISYRCQPGRCRQHAQAERQVFQIAPSRRNITYDDIWSARDQCDLLDGKPRSECYASFGMDADNIDEYLGRALCLEAALQATEQKTEIKVSTPFGEAHLPRPELPRGPLLHEVHLPEFRQMLSRLVATASAPGEHVTRLRAAMRKWHEEVGQSARFMFEDPGDASCDESLGDGAAGADLPGHDAQEQGRMQGQQ